MRTLSKILFISGVLAIVMLPVLMGVCFGGNNWPSVQKIEIREADGSLGWGSAVMLEGGYLVTAEHLAPVAGSWMNLRVTMNSVFDPAKNNIDEARILQISPTLVEKMPEVLHPAKIGATPKSGDNVSGYGFPNGWAKVYTGKVLRVTKDYIYCDFMIDHGASGGGLFNESGELIGVASGFDNDTHESLWISTDSLKMAVSHVSGAQHAQQKYDRSTPVVVLSQRNCPPCERLKRDIAAGRFPGYTFEFTTWDNDLQLWDKPELVANFVAECKPPVDPLVPTMWVPGTGKYTTGYDQPPGLLGFLESAIKFLLVGPPPRAPLAPIIQTMPQAPQQGVTPVPMQQATLLSEVAQLRSELATLRGHVNTFQEGGFITKLKGVAVLKEDKAQIEESVASIRKRLDDAKENPWGLLGAAITGLFTGPLHGWIAAKRHARSNVAV